MRMSLDDFDGFPEGELRYVQVPDLFFTGLAPIIDNLAELKIVLHLIWLRQRQGQQVVTLRSLETDETLARSMSACGGEVGLELEQGLESAVARGALLYAHIQTESGDESVYALNSEGGRRALSAVAVGDMRLEPEVGEQPVVEPRPNIFELYEDNIGLLSPILADELREAEGAYPADWIEEAFRLAVANNVRKWRYIRAILDRWATEGKDDGISRQNSEKGGRWYTEEEFEQFFEH